MDYDDPPGAYSQIVFTFSQSVHVVSFSPRHTSQVLGAPFAKASTV